MKEFLASIILLNSFLSICARDLHKPSPNATCEKLWVDYDVTDSGVKVMKIHVKFTAYDMQNMDAYLAVFFQYDDEIGKWLMDKNNKYNSSDGYVAVYRSIKPQYNPAVYNNLDIFMPYSELDLDPGEYDLAGFAERPASGFPGGTQSNDHTIIPARLDAVAKCRPYGMTGPDHTIRPELLVPSTINRLPASA